MVIKRAMMKKSTEPYPSKSVMRQDPERAQDLTGRDRLVSNVIFSFGGHLVFVVMGFMLPRTIDRSLGQELLGVWDFGWSIVSYFYFVQAGIGSSVSRYVAKHRAAGNTASVNVVVNSAICILSVSGFVVLVSTITMWFLIPKLFAGSLGEHVGEAKWVVLFLGASVGSQVALGAFTGVLTGCHQWGLHNTIRSGFDIAAIAAMLLVLHCGGGLRSLAIVAFLKQLLADILRSILSFRVCPGLRISPFLTQWKTVRSLLGFGAKTVVPSLSKLLLNQTTSILLVAYLGPASLALYTRPLSLVRHIQILVDRMALTLTPTVSSLQGTGGGGEIQRLLVKCVQYSIYIAVPMILVLVVFGGVILDLWMGTGYAHVLLIVSLACGYSIVIINLPLISVLRGLNAHGRAGLAEFLAAICSVGLTFLVLGPLNMGLVALAIATTLPLFVVNMVYVPMLVCRHIGLSLWQYYKEVGMQPIRYMLPFAGCLIVAKNVFYNAPIAGFISGTAIGGILLSVLYFKYVVPGSLKTRLLRLVDRRGGATGRL